MGITTSRRLAEATSCWLHYEYICQRAGLFDESALKSAVGQVLSSFVIDKPSRAWSNIPHPALGQSSGPGRKAEIDFVLAELNGSEMGNLRIAVEAKWADSTHCSPEKITYDFFRLAMLDNYLKSNNISAECVFLMAGTKGRIKELISKSPFSGKHKISLKQGYTQKIKGDIFDISKQGAWSKYFNKTASESAKAAATREGFPNLTISFSPGLPLIELQRSTPSVIHDHSVKFYAMAWSVKGS